MKSTTFSLSVSLFLVLISVNVWAHNPQVSNISIVQEVGSKKCSLLLSVPLVSCQQELKNAYPSIKVDSLSAVQFQELLLQHFKKSILFIANSGDTLLVNNGYINLGHETQMIFDISKMPQIINSLRLNYTALSSQYEHFAVLQISLADKISGKGIFNNENNYMLSLVNNNNELVQEELHATFPSSTNLILVVGGVLLFLIAFIFLRRNKIVTNSPAALNQQL